MNGQFEQLAKLSYTGINILGRLYARRKFALILNVVVLSTLLGFVVKGLMLSMNR